MLTINRQAPEEIYRQLYRQLRAEIETGVRQPASKLPSTRYLATRLAVSRTTVEHAYAELVAEGYLTTRPGAAYRVTTQLPFVVKTPALAPLEAPRLKADFTEAFDHLRLFPKQAWLAATNRVFDRGIDHIQPAQGDLSLRQQLVHFLARLKQIDVTPEQVVITSGFTSAAGVIAGLVPELATTGVAVAEPSAPNTQTVWATLGVPHRLVHDTAWPTAGGYLVTPTHNFPDSASWSLARRSHFAAWLAEQAGYLIEVDTDGNLPAQPLAALFTLRHGERAFYYLNFDEVLGSGLSLGVLVLPPALVTAYEARYGHLPNRNSQLQQQILAQLIANDDLERFMRQLTLVYGNRRRLLADALTAAFGDRLTLLGESAGSFITVRVALGQSVPALTATAAAAGVGVVNPDRCWGSGTPPYQSLVFSIRQAGDAEILAGVETLKTAWQQ